MASRAPRSVDRRPWVGMAGLLTGCGTTGIGIVLGLDPDVILLRAFAAGVAMAVVAAVVKGMVTRILRPE
jgi:hypothetical protein